MYAPGNRALKVNVSDCPGLAERKAILGSIWAEWKSIECGSAPRFTRVNSIVSPCLTCRTGPGMSPLKVQLETVISGATLSGTSIAVNCTLRLRSAETGGSAGSYRRKVRLFVASPEGTAVD